MVSSVMGSTTVDLGGQRPPSGGNTVSEQADSVRGDNAHQVARRVWTLAEEWAPALAERVASRHGVPGPACEELARMALAYVGVAAFLALAHADEEPSCRRAGHPHACVTEVTLTRALGQIPASIRGGCLESVYRDLLVEALSLWRASLALPDVASA